MISLHLPPTVIFTTLAARALKVYFFIRILPHISYK